MAVLLGATPLTIADIVAVARRGEPVELSADAVERMTATRAIIESLADDDRPHYGVSTGFGALATTHIVPERRRDLQRSLVRSHAASSGPEVERDEPACGPSSPRGTSSCSTPA
jgi:histidine ammonia-lyase